ncbi:PREDICTED: homeobox protein invected-like, partial [Nicrophorus vespilloides]|uniref:Homeobox protein invected-like n=1 Tax=Nicrophorus vespilloides TaxID=110193 RepID=A0ABM1MP86_NICVS
MAALTSNLVSPKYFGRNLESTDGSVSMDSNDFGRESPNLDNASCCSDDTVLSVGNENPVVHQEENLSFKNIESHLNAISKITNSTLDPNNSSSIKSDPSSPNSHRLSPASTKSESPNFIYRNIEKSNPTSPESYDKFRQASVSSPLSPSSQKTTAYTSGPDSPQSPKLDSKPFYFRQNSTKNDNNNEPSNGNLKFSIDNILKADFGRRITDPINIRKVKPKKLVPEAPRRSFEQETVTSSGSAPAAAAAATAASSAVGGPVDLSKAEPEKKEGASGSSQPMLWPAWVYCTRYSDRPSS